MGVVAGGYFFNSIGGYNDPKALPFAIFMTTMASCAGMPIVFVDSFRLALSLLWV